MERYFSINRGGFSIRCKLYCRDIHAIDRVVVFVHGFAGHKDTGSAARFAEKLLGKHKTAALVTFDLPAHGEDARKRITLADSLRYLDLVTQYLAETYAAPLFAYATSFGGYLTLAYLSQKGNPFRRIVLRCPAVDMYQALCDLITRADQWGPLQKGRDAAVGFDRKVLVSPAFLEELRQTDVRQADYLDWAEDIQILQGTDDEIIPECRVRDFAEEQLMEYIPIQGADHRFHDPKKMDLAIKEILEFLFPR